MIEIAITNEQTTVAIDADRLRQAVAGVLRAAGRDCATISIAVVDDPTIHDLNRRHLQHDYPTDVLSFLLEEDEETLDGEIIVSGDHAAALAPNYGWLPADELLLYVIHGALHLVGYDDQSPADAACMRQEEARHLATFSLTQDAARHESELSGPARRPRDSQFSPEGAS